MMLDMWLGLIFLVIITMLKHFLLPLFYLAWRCGSPLGKTLKLVTSAIVAVESLIKDSPAFLYLHVNELLSVCKWFLSLFTCLRTFLLIFLKCSTVLRPWFGIRVIDVKQHCKLVSVPGKEVDASDRDLYVYVEEVTYWIYALKFQMLL